MEDPTSDDEAVTHALGEEIRRARDKQGWTRAELVKRMDVDISVQTLANYEYGIRHCTVVRLVQVCRALDVSSTSLLGLALQRAEVESDIIQVDLHALAGTSDADLMLLRVWAQNTLSQDADGVAKLAPPLVEQWAVMLGTTRAGLARRLSAFRPDTASAQPA